MFLAIRQRLTRSIKRVRSADGFAGSESGATAVEFALVAAPFMAVLMALFQTALVFFASRVLDETTEQASRYIMTGQAQSSGMSQSGFKTWVCGQTFALFNCNNFMINVQAYSSFSAASTTTPTLTYDANGNVNNSFGYNTGNAGDIVVVQVMYQWPV